VPPAPVPYREPLFELLAGRGAIEPVVIYQSGAQASWDQPAGWFPAEHSYDAIRLRSRQLRRRGGRTPVTWPRGLERELSRLEPAVVVSWEFGAATLRCLRWCRRRRRPLVIFSEVTPAMEPRLGAVRRAVHRRVAARAAGFVAASSAARARLRGLGVPADAVEVSLQAADVERFRRVAEGAAREGDGSLRVLSVGRLVEEKNVAALIDACAAADPDGERIELEVCGTGPLEGALRARAERRRVRSRFSGYVAPAELPEVYARADAFVLVSLAEPFGVAVREAVAAALPVVCASTAGAAGDVAVEGANALLVDPRDGAALAAALDRLARDPELRARMAAESRRLDGELTLDRSAEAFERAVARAAV
jgi:glycosyltransferase involved in cell wall biosynthesis